MSDGLFLSYTSANFKKKRMLVFLQEELLKKTKVYSQFTIRVQPIALQPCYVFIFFFVAHQQDEEVFYLYASKLKGTI